MTDLWNKAIQQAANSLAVNNNNPDEQSIGRMLSIYADLLGLDCSTNEYKDAVRKLRNKFLEKIDEGTTLIDNEESLREEWLPEMNQSGTIPHRWFAYQQYLQEQQGADFNQTQSLDRSTKKILSLLSDPRKNHAPVRRKGLILGDVQSGKTRTYMALMNRAVDYGYKMIVVLTSSDEGLRYQTQRRIDTDFLGCEGQPTRKTVGIGAYLNGKGISTPISLTNEDDFIKSYSKAFQSLPRPNWNDRPVIAVMKKNGSVLRKFNQWLDTPEFPKDLPMLIIDDESDYASVNSAKDDESPTAINGLLRELCEISERSSYVAVTATPFANVFIDDEIEEDLFPKDFIHILPTPPAYIGARKLFGDLDNPGQEETCVQELDKDDLKEWLPLSHKKYYRFDSEGINELDYQVAYAIDCFLVACILRLGAENKRQSMLIHMSRFTAVQEQIADMVNDYVGNVVFALKFHYDNPNDPRIQALHDAYNREYAANNQTHGMSWDQVLHKMRVSTERLQVRLVNSDASRWNEINQVPDDDERNEAVKRECTIYVGGNRISRGMTLKGLICSVFYRNVTAADTLLQMGRWFGYRPGYADLQRIWLTDQSIIDFRYACSIVEHLKKQAKQMENEGQTPRQFGLAIMKNPAKGVRITGAAKMRNATEGDSSVLASFNLEGQLTESVRLSVDSERLLANDAALSNLIAACDTDPKVSTADSSMRVYRHVPASTVTEFLSHYRAGYGDRRFGPTLLQYKSHVKEIDTTMACEYAKTQQQNNPGNDWNIAFINGSGERVKDVNFNWKQAIRKSTYDSDHNQFLLYGRSLRLAGKDDVLSVAKVVSPVPTPKTVTGDETDYYLTDYFGDSPTLMLYRVHIKPSGKNTEPTPDILDSGNGVLAAKLVIPTDGSTDDPQHRGDVYYYNTVSVRQEYNRLMEHLDPNDGEDDEE